MDVLLVVHDWLRWAVLAALLGGGAYALLQAPRDAAVFRRPIFSVAVGVVDIQVLIGLVLYVAGGAWREGLFSAVLHPLAMVVAAAIAHVGLARGAREGSRRGHQVVGAAFLLALGFVIVGIPWA